MHHRRRPGDAAALPGIEEYFKCPVQLIAQGHFIHRHEASIGRHLERGNAHPFKLDNFKLRVFQKIGDGTAGVAVIWAAIT